jgi:hypothetical protein
MRFVQRVALIVVGVLLFTACESPVRRPVEIAFPVKAFPNYAAVADSGIDSMMRAFYAGSGLWRDCPRTSCWIHNSDWGSDALTDTLYLHWETTRDRTTLPVLAALAISEREYPRPCSARENCPLWSDVPMWDSVAASREYAALPADRLALDKATAAFWAIEGSPVYDRGACPAIRYQRPSGRGDRLKTLETDSNGIKAALLLYRATHDRRYLKIARIRYHAARRYFLDARLPLYSVYVFDDGTHCRQEPHRFFASVNGNMIWNGLELARVTGDARYRTQAIATAKAVERYLSDPNGIFADLQAENDLEEPLVEAMFDLATSEHRAFARRWLVDNAAAAYSARRTDGTFGRFFDGPPPASDVTAWQTSGAFALEVAAAAIAPTDVMREPAWDDAAIAPRDIRTIPATIRFHGSGIALIGTLGEVCCQPGHARILVDGRETTNRIGTWQNKSSSGRQFPNSVLFAWRWPTCAEHSITLLPGIYDAKEGGSFVHVRSVATICGKVGNATSS